MDTQPCQPVESRANSSRLPGTTSNTSLIGTQQECRHQLVQHDAINAATKNITQDSQLQIVQQTGSSKNKKQHTLGFEYIHMNVSGHQLTVQGKSDECIDLCEQFITTFKRKPPWSTKAFLRTVRNMLHHDVVNSGIFRGECPNKYPCEWTKDVLITLDEATEAYMVQVIAESHC